MPQGKEKPKPLFPFTGKYWEKRMDADQEALKNQSEFRNRYGSDPDINKAVPVPDVTRIHPDDAQYESERAEVAAQRTYKVRPGMTGYNYNAPKQKTLKSRMFKKR